jgi:hypothetical protein
MSRSIRPLPLGACMAFSGTALLLLYSRIVVNSSNKDDDTDVTWYVKVSNCKE